MAQIDLNVAVESAALEGQRTQRKFRDGERFFIDIDAGEFVRQRVFSGLFGRGTVFDAAREGSAEGFEQKHARAARGIDDAARADVNFFDDRARDGSGRVNAAFAFAAASAKYLYVRRTQFQVGVLARDVEPFAQQRGIVPRGAGQRIEDAGGHAHAGAIDLQRAGELVEPALRNRRCGAKDHFFSERNNQRFGAQAGAVFDDRREQRAQIQRARSSDKFGRADHALDSGNRLGNSGNRHGLGEV